jgi:hypothetical protein
VIDTDGAVVTSATLTIKLSKAGGAIAVRNDATSITHDSDGYYLVTLNATDTNTIGRLKVLVTGSGFIPFAEAFSVLHANVYDWLYGSAAPNTAAPLDAAGVRSAVGLGSANLDTQIADLPTVSEFNARTLPSADYFDPVTDTVASVTTVGSVTGNVGGNVVGSVGSLAAQAVLDVLGAFGTLGSVNDGSATASGFSGDLGLSSSDNFYVGSVLAFTSGTLDGIARKVTGYTGATRTFAFADAFPAAPANAATFVILGRIN